MTLPTNWFKEATGHLSDGEFMKEYYKAVGDDIRDDNDRNYP
jgi:hypothetical protein